MDWGKHFEEVSKRGVEGSTASFGAPLPVDTVVITERDDWRTGWLLPIVGAAGFVVSWFGGYAAARAHQELERSERHPTHHARYARGLMKTRRAT